MIGLAWQSRDGYSAGRVILKMPRAVQLGKRYRLILEELA